jgi:hypothetical protein
MAIFSTNVEESTKEKPLSEGFDPYADYLKKRSEAAQKWEGSATAYRPETSLADSTKAEDTYKSGEYNRRVGATKQQQQLSQAQDTRTSSIADRVKDALYNRQKAETDFATQSSQQDRTAGLSAQSQMQEYGQGIAKQDFTAYSNSADRYDAIKTAYNNGLAEQQILEANKNSVLKIADIEKFYALAKQDFDNMTADWSAMSDQQLKQSLEKIKSDASNWGSIITGLFESGGLLAINALKGTTA